MGLILFQCRSEDNISAEKTNLENNQIPLNSQRNLFLLANTHLYYNVDHPSIQLGQTKVVLDTIKRFLMDNFLKNIPIFLCGDFNSTPSSVVYKLLSTGEASSRHPSALHHGQPICSDEIISNDLSLASLYGSTISEPLATTSILTVDYIWYSTGRIIPTKVLQLPTRKELRSLPTLFLPSDHVSLVGEFLLLPPEPEVVFSFSQDEIRSEMEKYRRKKKEVYDLKELKAKEKRRDNRKAANEALKLKEMNRRNKLKG
eukprot:TRINITY_DN5181_c0_g1_i1.p1 TRINITY_DN5181_c0_g1~~TRINITY_DN5181_c0_g1_i1.p1  ORF type:complete len:258 (-),score=55.22 TRINITY_DN5181_c0_g1_i1:64-837(-)